MLNLKELWIGDTVRIISSSRIGKYEGIHPKGKARINVNGKILLVSAKNLLLHEEEDKIEEIKFEDIDEVTVVVDDTIDLHIEKLKPDLVTALPERIYDYQMKAFKTFLKKAISSHKNEFIIIHGKGTGVLRQSVMDYIKTESSIRFYEVINDGGAVKIHL